MPPLRGALPVDETQSFKRYPYSGGFAPMSRARAIALAQHTLHLSQGKGAFRFASGAPCRRLGLVARPRHARKRACRALRARSLRSLAVKFRCAEFGLCLLVFIAARGLAEAVTQEVTGCSATGLKTKTDRGSGYRSGPIRSRPGGR